MFEKLLKIAHYLDNIGLYKDSDKVLKISQVTIGNDTITKDEIENPNTFADNYVIPEERLPELQAGIDKINKIMDKLRGLYPNEKFEPASYVLGERIFKKKRQDDLSVEPAKQIPYINVTVKGSIPRLSEWSFLARIIHGVDDSGRPMNTFMMPPGKEIPSEYKNVGPNCEHCNQNRRRIDTYVLEHPEHGTRQVGSSCLSDFLGHKSPQAMAQCLTYLSDFRDMLSSEFGGARGGDEWIDSEFFDTVAAFLADKFGYMSVKKANEINEEIELSGSRRQGVMSTKQIINNFVHYGRLDKYGREEMEPYMSAWRALSVEQKAEYTELSKLAIERAKGFKDLENVNDFQWNLSAAAHDQHVHPRKTGLRAYIPADLIRERKRAEENAQKANAPVENPSNFPQVNYVVGEKFIALVTLLSTKGIDGMYLSTLHKFRDSHGKILTWFASGYDNNIADPGTQLYIKGTVKKIEDYKGTPQIQITRVSEIPPEEIDSNGNLIKKKKVKPEPEIPREPRGRL